MRRDCNRYTKLDFGKYKGYDLGIVFVFDRPYLEWCLNNIEQFYITDWDRLIAMNVMAFPTLDWQTKHYMEPEARFGFNEFESFKELEDILNYKENPSGMCLQKVPPDKEMLPVDWELIYANGRQNGEKAPTIIIVLHGVDRDIIIIIHIGIFNGFAHKAKVDVMSGDDAAGYLPDASKCKIG